MTDNELQQVFQNYLEAFAVTSPAEQERLLQSSLADDVVFTNPGVNGSGLRNLLTHIAGFQKRFPGGRFRMNWLRQQHEQALLEWTQLDQNGTALVTGHSYARLNSDHRIANLAGFWTAGAV